MYCELAFAADSLQQIWCCLRSMHLVSRCWCTTAHAVPGSFLIPSSAASEVTASSRSGSAAGDAVAVQGWRGWRNEFVLHTGMRAGSASCGADRP